MTISVGILNQTSPEINFRLDTPFLYEFEEAVPDFGFNGLGEITYFRTYSRLKDDGTKEEWWETIKRVIEGTYSIQKRHVYQNGLYWNESKAQNSAQEMYRLMFDMKFLPPGRGLWAMGTDIIEKRGLFEALNNCAFKSTASIEDDPTEPFTYMMDGSMLGVGVGFDTKGAGKVTVRRPSEVVWNIFKIPDTREGWVEALGMLLDSYFLENKKGVEFNYSQIRPAGLPLKTFGGTSSGYKPLEKMLEKIRRLLNHREGNYIAGTELTERDIVDIMNIIGECVVAGNVRRTAQIAFGNSTEFINLKNYKINPDRKEHGWASNNSYFAKVGGDYYEPVQLSQVNGEPGYFWLENAQDFGRMGRNWNERYKCDHRACGGNPCLEQTLEDAEMCCLVETFPHRIESLVEFQKVLKYAYLYAKTVTLGRTHWTRANEVMLRNRRIGTSISGVAQFVEANGIAELKRWLDNGYKTIEAYDLIYSEWFKVPKSIKITSVKPSGTISLLAGATPGIHYPESRYYLRRVTINKNDPTLHIARAHGVKIEPHLMWSNDVEDWIESDISVQAVFPIDSGMEKVKPSMYEQLELAAFIQEWWADNQVSVTVSFDIHKPQAADESDVAYELRVSRPDEASQIERALEFYQFRLKGVSFLPRRDLSVDFPQLPYEEIDETTWLHHVGQQSLRKNQGHYVVRTTKFDDAFQDAIAESFCSNDTCDVPQKHISN